MEDEQSTQCVTIVAILAVLALTYVAVKYLKQQGSNDILPDVDLRLDTDDAGNTPTPDGY